MAADDTPRHFPTDTSPTASPVPGDGAPSSFRFPDDSDDSAC